MSLKYYGSFLLKRVSKKVRSHESRAPTRRRGEMNQFISAEAVGTIKNPISIIPTNLIFR